jgi:hypothetical protein
MTPNWIKEASMIVVCILLSLLTASALGIGFRMRGGLWGDKIGWGATTARIVAWAIPVALVTWAWYQFAWYFALATGVLAFAGATIGWFGGIDMGRMHGTWIRDFTVMTLVGFVKMLGVALMIGLAGFHTGAVAVSIAGALCGVMYELGWRTPSTRPGFQTGPELGELYFGALVGLAISLGAWLL